jgi:cupin 2 domain-containing protein
MIENIFKNIPHNLSDELNQTLVKNNKIRIERIVSKGHSSPKDFWYDQEENEWVILLKGKAKIVFKENLRSQVLSVGDFLNIPAHTHHRVDWTGPNQETIWLAIFY